MRYTVNLDSKTHYVSKNGTVPLTLRVSVNGEHDYLNTGKRIKVTQYDIKTKSIKSGINGYTQLTSFITRQKKRVDEIMEVFEKRNEVATITKVKEQYAQETGKVKSSCFYEYVTEVIKWGREHSDLSEGTLDNYEIRLKKIRDYRVKLSIHDINAKFVISRYSRVSNFFNQTADYSSSVY